VGIGVGQNRVGGGGRRGGAGETAEKRYLLAFWKKPSIAFLLTNVVKFYSAESVPNLGFGDYEKVGQLSPG
jgi:hypothetical protein